MRILEPSAEECSRIAATTELFSEACAARGTPVTADGRIGEADAAVLLGYQLASLQNLRTMGGGPAHYKRRAGTSKISYRLCDLAGWVEQTREE
tara:strand:+ start:16646 stop:16927 length:282 start_codon:yes stop_codon:yes gene_type:complete